MPRKNNDNNPLQIKLKAVSLPRVSPERYYQRLMEFVRTGRPLPSSWEVDVLWRNPKTKHGMTKRWRSDDFESAVTESAGRGGFNDILYGALQRKLRVVQERKRRR